MTLWAITSYFNPARRASRLRNYRVFRSRLNVPLLTVELALHGKPELTPEDADQLHCIQGGEEHILWQKERLLNVAIGLLPVECTAVAWLDSDIIFQDPHWHRKASELLANHQLIQLFDQVVYLPRGVTDVPRSDALQPEHHPWHCQPGAVSNALAERPVAYPKLNQRGTTTTGNPGMAWAAQRSILHHHGLYDRAIVGSGDLLLYAALFGREHFVTRRLGSGTPARLDFDQWADGLRKGLCTSVAYLDGMLYHLWHGELVDRGYNERHRAFAQFDFDPATDICLDGNGCWRWSSDKPELHTYLRYYFESRREDGAASSASHKE